ncbi:Kelch-like protein 12 [Orchesella cincta]|uniref:Kelch-like protein 12 n=1 Tax=Orchesella cincta TaxID=48709 RepID=A0A1D2MW52_ORCCI|nr:Kelch-like protein 12 [Orchesella cincta]
MERDTTNSITVQKNVTFYLEDSGKGLSKAYFPFPTFPNSKPAYRLHGCLWSYKYFFEQTTHPSGQRVESDACQLYLYLMKNNDNSDIELQLYCDSGSKASVGGWTLGDMKWASVKIAFVNPETRQIMTHKKEAEGATPCGKSSCPCNASKACPKLCYRKQNFCSPEYLQSFFVINKCSKPRYGMSATYYCSLDAFVTVTLFRESPKTLSKINVHDLYWKSQHEASKKMFHAQIGTDFKLEVNGQEFPCHKCILAGHSEVFTRMFTNESKRKSATGLAMESMSAAGVESFLKYLYYGDTSFSQLPPNVALELMKAGEKYCIPHLRKASYEILNSKSYDELDCSTAMKLFLFASNTLQYVALKRMALLCFGKKYVELVKSEEFAKLFEENREIAQEILIKIHKTSQ